MIQPNPNLIFSQFNPNLPPLIVTGASDAAEEAFMALFTCGRDVTYEDIKEKMEIILREKEKSSLFENIPILIMHQRNHTKSLAPGSGAGERSVAERMLVALFDLDKSSALAIIELFPLYGNNTYFFFCSFILLLMLCLLLFYT